MTKKRINTNVGEANLKEVAAQVENEAKILASQKRQIANRTPLQKKSKDEIAADLKKSNAAKIATAESTFAEKIAAAEKNKNVSALTKKSKAIFTSYKGVRSMLIDMFNSDMYEFSMSEVKFCELLKSSRNAKNVSLHQTLMQICPFTYAQKEVKTVTSEKGKKVTIVENKVIQKYVVKNLLTACQLYFDNAEMSPAAISSLQRENVLSAIKVAKNAVKTAQNKVHELSLDYEQVSADRKADKLKSLQSAEKSLLSKVELYETVCFDAN